MKQRVYISHSLLDTSNILECLIKYFEQQGFIVDYYKKGEVYSDEKLRKANFLIFIPYQESQKISYNLTETFIGRGQFTEYKLAEKLKIPSFLYHNILVRSGEKETTFVDVSCITAAKINDENDWKRKYGILRSRERCTRTFKPSVAKTKRKLLLLLQNG